jgi:hypothetical protein
MQFSPISVTSSLFGPNILLNTLFSNIPSLNVRDQVSHPYKTTGKIIVLYILIRTFLDSKRGDKWFGFESALSFLMNQILVDFFYRGSQTYELRCHIFKAYIRYLDVMVLFYILVTRHLHQFTWNWNGILFYLELAVQNEYVFTSVTATVFIWNIFNIKGTEGNVRNIISLIGFATVDLLTSNPITILY